MAGVQGAHVCALSVSASPRSQQGMSPLSHVCPVSRVCPVCPLCAHPCVPRIRAVLGAQVCPPVPGHGPTGTPVFLCHVSVPACVCGCPVSLCMPTAPQSMSVSLQAQNLPGARVCPVSMGVSVPTQVPLAPTCVEEGGPHPCPLPCILAAAMTSPADMLETFTRYTGQWVCGEGVSGAVSVAPQLPGGLCTPAEAQGPPWKWDTHPQLDDVQDHSPGWRW